jgi:hypothetical protein
MKKKVLMCDPPEGWKYGFPKPLNDEDFYLMKSGNDVNIHRWLIEQGYPKEAIDSYGELFYCRYWESEIEVEDGENEN